MTNPIDSLESALELKLQRQLYGTEPASVSPLLTVVWSVRGLLNQAGKWLIQALTFANCARGKSYDKRTFGYRLHADYCGLRGG